MNARSRGSSVDIVCDYGSDDGVRSPAEAKDFSSSLCVQTGSGAHAASCPMGTGSPFPGGKGRLRRDADHSPSSSAEVMNDSILIMNANIVSQNSVYGSAPLKTIHPTPHVFEITMECM
jgi:hypothetical protein